MSLSPNGHLIHADWYSDMARKKPQPFINMHDGTALSAGIVRRVKCVCGQVIYVEAESTRKLCTICNQSTLGKRIRVK